MSEIIDEHNFKKYIDDFFDNLELYDDHRKKHNYKSLLKAGIDVFLNYESDYTAKEVYESFFMIYQITQEDKSRRQENKNIVGEPNLLLNLVKVMEKYEKTTGELIERQRDHFIHSVNVFLLGIAIYSQNKKYRNIFKSYILSSKYEKYYRDEEGNISDEEFLYRWGIASLLHDIGYPFEIVGKQLKKIINDGVKSISNSYEVKLGIDFDDFNEFNSIVKIHPYDFADRYRKNYNKSKFLNLYRPTDILAHKIAHDFELDFHTYKAIAKHLYTFVEYMKLNNFIDHGFYSSILVLNSYGKLMQKYAKNKDFFFYPVVDSATAILLHNYFHNTLQKIFSFDKLDPSTNPIAFLLILCDELQEWNRQPFGLIDKKKLYVNELAIEINETDLRLKYILKQGILGFNFSKDKENTIRDILNVDALFEDFKVKTDVEPEMTDKIIKNLEFDETQVPDILIRNLEKLAIEINEEYNRRITLQYNKNKKNGKVDKEIEKSYNALCDFDELDSEFKLSNLRQARSIPKKLSMIGCEIAPAKDKRQRITKAMFDDNEIIALAILEHNEWCEEKRGCGWTYGEEKDDEKLKSPYLVEWDELDEDIKKLDIAFIKKIPALLSSVGLKVVRNRMRLLTFKMQEFYDEHKLNPDDTGEERFNALKDHVKYSNYRQADFIVKILNEMKYDIVPENDVGNAIEKFTEDEIDYFAEREHYGWCMLKYELGWTYGKKLDEKEMTSPNLVKWDDLNVKLQTNNKETFRHLPEMCADPNVGLKIVRSE